MSKINGILSTSHLAHIANTEFQDRLQSASDIKCTAFFRCRQALLRYGTADNLHRPYLYLKGNVSSISGDFPCNINEIALGEQDSMKNPGPVAVYQLDFNQDELARLCSKGLFTKDFKCPDIFIDNDFELPLTCDCKYLEPEQEEDAPIFIIDIKNQYNMIMNSADTGYDLPDYFDEVIQSVQQSDYNNANTYHDDIYAYDDDFLFNDNQKSDDLIQPAAEQNDLNKQEDAERIDITEETTEESRMRESYANIWKAVNDKLEDENNNAKSDENKDKKPMAINTTVTGKKTQQPEDIKDVEEERKDEMNNKNKAVIINQAENLEDELPANRRDIPANFADIAEADDDLYYDDGDEEFIN